MLTTSYKLSDIISVRSRFGRSVNLERDFYDKVSLDGYVLTTTAREALTRFTQAFADPLAARAWTLTGPYGSGKSAFALFAAKVFSPERNPDTQEARGIIKSNDEDLWRNLFDHRRKTSLGKRGLLPVLVSGSREPLGQALLRGLAQALENGNADASMFLLAEINDLLESGANGKAISSRSIVELFIEAAKYVKAAKKNGANGLLIVIDELGKLLEYAALSREDDIFVLQELAEATRRNNEAPIFLLTILHQSFERYVERLGRTQKEEWMKVQGRFEDMAFQEPTEQLLRIINQAIQHIGPEAEKLKAHGEDWAQQAVALGLLGSLNRENAIATLSGCAPLHPTVALLLGPLFRRVGQNERSLFAFLTSPEPCGFQEFLAVNEWQNGVLPAVRLDGLYDYIVTALGSALYAQADGRKWAEIEATLNRLADASQLEVKLIKAIGLLRLVGDTGHLKSSAEILKFAFAGEEVSEQAISHALTRLQEKSVIIYRRYNSAFSLWEGSDINLDDCVREARAYIDPKESLAVSLSKHFNPNPIVARRHSLQTGTLRFFDVRYTDINNLEKSLQAPLDEADGRILYAIALNDEEARASETKVSAARMRNLSQTIVAIPQETMGLQDAIFEVACLRWVKTQTPELDNDRAARNELKARLAFAESYVENWLQSLISPTASLHTAGCLWYHRGRQLEIDSTRGLQESLSTVCDEVFTQTPKLRNELINRRHPSSSAAAARKDLIAAMLNHADKPQLGIVGYPPHSSIYFSLLQETGLHRKENGDWGFYEPLPDADPGIVSVWRQIDNFLTVTEVERRSVSNLFDELSQAPFGLKAGPLPILLFATLLHFDTEVALYEQGSFVPALSMPVFERLVKAPETFQLQRCRIAGVRALVFEHFANVLSLKRKSKDTKKLNLLTIVKALTRFAIALPEYTRNTKRLSARTLRLRQAIFAAREPDKLLFQDLPKACGVPSFVENDERGKSEVDLFFKRLRESLAELQRAYDDLLGELEKMLIAAFSLKETGEKARLELRQRALPLADLTVETKIKSFVIRASDKELDLADWLASLATLLSGKPPMAWSDTDLARFEINLAEVTRSFLHIELLAFEVYKPEGFYSDREVIRLGVTAINQPEQQRVLSISQTEQTLIGLAEISIEKAFLEIGLNGNTELRLAVLAKLTQKFLSELEQKQNQTQNPKAVKQSAK